MLPSLQLYHNRTPHIFSSLEPSKRPVQAPSAMPCSAGDRGHTGPAHTQRHRQRDTDNLTHPVDPLQNRTQASHCPSAQQSSTSRAEKKNLVILLAHSRRLLVPRMLSQRKSHQCFLSLVRAVGKGV